jgi:hypothetical protein
MAKRRTRKDKELSKHFGTISWNPASSPSSVNSQNPTSLEPTSSNSAKLKFTNASTNTLDLASIKKDLLKSLLLSVFIVGFELVIYFFYNK